VESVTPARVAAWAVHVYTASGLVLAAAAAALIVRGDEAALHGALLLFLLATVIDATDGVLARRARVAAVLPQFDGRRLDDIIDFQTYTSLPLLLIWRSGALPGDAGWLLLVPLLASAYGFAQTHAKTADGYFLGFPSYWNVVAFYLVILAPPTWLSAGILVTLAALTFVPARYLYPSMRGALNRGAAAGGAAWGVLIALILTGVLRPAQPWALLSLAYPAWYLAASWAVTLRRRSRGRPAPP
jgi:phosphatidylcholine synthase